MSLRILHILNDSRGLDTFPSVYNALYIWNKYGAKNYIATGGSCEEFNMYLSAQFNLSGTFTERWKQLSKIQDKFDVAITYEPIDLEIFILSKLRKRINYHIHHSLEIPYLYFSKISFKKIIHRLLVRFGYSAVDMILIQDVERHELLKRLFTNTQKIPCLYVPNSFINSIEPIFNSLSWFDEIRKRKKRIVLYVGALEEWALPISFFDDIKMIQDAHFVFNGWSRTKGYIEKLQNYCKGNNNITFKIGISTRKELNYIVKNSDIGLAVYSTDDSDLNVKMIGMSSGKIHKYLSYNKPVVLTELPGISAYLCEKMMGVVYGAKLSIEEAIKKVNDNYEKFVDSIKENYHDDCDYEMHYSKVIQLYLANMYNKK